MCWQKILVGFNDLKSSFPQIAKEAFEWDPSAFTSNSGFKKKWICKEGHVFSQVISNRTRHNQGCPKCAGRSPISGVNDLATIHPTLSREAYGWDATQVSCFSHKVLKWQCPEGHLWDSSPAGRLNSQSSEYTICSICDNRELLKGFNDLATTHPVIAAQAIG